MMLPYNIDSSISVFMWLHVCFGIIELHNELALLVIPDLKLGTIALCTFHEVSCRSDRSATLLHTAPTDYLECTSCKDLQ